MIVGISLCISSKPLPYHFHQTSTLMEMTPRMLFVAEKERDCDLSSIGVNDKYHIGVRGKNLYKFFDAISLLQGFLWTHSLKYGVARDDKIYQ